MDFSTVMRTTEDVLKVAKVVNEFEELIGKKIKEGMSMNDVIDAIAVCVGLQAGQQANPEAAVLNFCMDVSRVSREVMEK